MNNHIKFPTEEEIKEEAQKRWGHYFQMRDAFELCANWMRSEVLRLNETKEVKTKEEIEKLAEEIIEILHGNSDWFEAVQDYLIHKGSFGKIATSIINQCQSQGGYTEKQIEVFAVYKNLLDYPDKYVVRRWVGTTPDQIPLAVENNLQDARAKIPKGKVLIPRAEDDDIVILETWL